MSYDPAERDEKKLLDIQEAFAKSDQQTDPPSMVALAFGDAISRLTPVGRLLRKVGRLMVWRME